MSKRQTRKVSALASAPCYQIEIVAKITNTNLSTEELVKVQSDLKHRLQSQIPKLPFAHMYPFEVTVK